jgi:hypothetical protein
LDIAKLSEKAIQGNPVLYIGAVSIVVVKKEVSGILPRTVDAVVGVDVAAQQTAPFIQANVAAISVWVFLDPPGQHDLLEKASGAHLYIGVAPRVPRVRGEIAARLLKEALPRFSGWLGDYLCQLFTLLDTQQVGRALLPFGYRDSENRLDVILARHDGPSSL